MKKGKLKKIDWNKLQMKRFALPYPDQDADIECGSWALHTITKKSWRSIQKLSKDGHWPNKTMFNFLRKEGFDITPITLGSMVESHSIETLKPELNYSHLILVDQMAYKEQNSWSVIYDGYHSHSGVIESMNPLEFINYPIEAAYLITRSKG